MTHTRTAQVDHRQLADDCRLLERIYRQQDRLDMADASRRRRIWHQQKAREAQP